MAIWSAEIKELEKLYESLKGLLPDLEKELVQLTRTEDANVVLLYSRRCLEVIITDLCDCELKRDRGTEPLKGVMDKLNKEKKIPAHIITSMHGLNELSTYGAHPKDFDPEQVKPVLINLNIIIKWYAKHKGFLVADRSKAEVGTEESKQPEIKLKDKSIIVLPFENISPDPDQEYFSNGLTEEIITDLSHLHDLLVISRNSAMTFKGSGKTTKEIAEKVNVRYVLEGSVRKAGNNLRITAQLIDALSDSHVWAEKYNGSLDDIFDIQEKVSRSIVDSLKVRLNSKEEYLISFRPIKNVKAYEYYLQARQGIYRFTEDGLDQGLRMIKKGLEIVGENELLYAEMGTIYFIFIDAGIKSVNLFLHKIEECANVIFKLNPGSPDGYYLLGLCHLLRGNIQLAIKDLKKCLVVDQNNSDCLIQLTRIYCSAGKNSAARELLNKLLILDPLNTIVYSLLGYPLVTEGQFDSAVEAYFKMYEMDPESPIFRWFYAWALIFAKNNSEAFRIIDRLVEDSPDTIFASYGLLFKYALSDKKEDALKIITPKTKAASKGTEYGSRAIAEGYAILGEKEMAIDWLENSINCGFINYPFYAEIDPFLINIRKEDRFKKLMERIKYEWENLET
jgi:TolB-like protein/Flp pilus assembly protein TadD